MNLDTFRLNVTALNHTRERINLPTNIDKLSLNRVASNRRINISNLFEQTNLYPSRPPFAKGT